MRKNVLGVPVDLVGKDEALDVVAGFLRRGRKAWIMTPYSETVVAANNDRELQEMFKAADLSLVDGSGLLAALEFTSYKISNIRVVRILQALFVGGLIGLKLFFNKGLFRIQRETVPGVDFVKELCRLAAGKGYKVYFLGGGEGVAALAAQKLRQEIRGLAIEAHAGPKDIKRAGAVEMEKLVAEINRSRPDLLLVAFKPIEQEKWLYHHLNGIDAKVFMAVGGAFDMIAGVKKRAPQTLRRLSLEWLWRLIIEPYRLGRIYRAVVIFPWLVFKKVAFGKFGDLDILSSGGVPED